MTAGHESNVMDGITRAAHNLEQAVIKAEDTADAISLAAREAGTLVVSSWPDRVEELCSEPYRPDQELLEALHGLRAASCLRAKRGLIDTAAYVMEFVDLAWGAMKVEELHFIKSAVLNTRMLAVTEPWIRTEILRACDDALAEVQWTG